MSADYKASNLHEWKGLLGYGTRIFGMFILIFHISLGLTLIGCRLAQVRALGAIFFTKWTVRKQFQKLLISYKLPHTFINQYSIFNQVLMRITPLRSFLISLYNRTVIVLGENTSAHALVADSINHIGCQQYLCRQPQSFSWDMLIYMSYLKYMFPTL